jgi:2-polyprenyl-3-methyl-5-hydroxy-6-metoxy-1,4-benzoquinol methylase
MVTGGMIETRDPVAAAAYHGSARADVLSLVPSGARRVLDVGCGAGRLGQELKESTDVEVVGIELNPEVARSAAAFLDRVICASGEYIDVEELDPPFDCIIFADVLEHLVSPWATLRRFVDCLTPEGRIVASLPNVAHWGVIAGLLRGRWDYQDRGLLDRTHLRFFTRRSVADLFAQAGLVIERWERNYRLLEADRRYARLARWLARGPLRDLITFQYLVVARKQGEWQ